MVVHPMVSNSNLQNLLNQTQILITPVHLLINISIKRITKSPDQHRLVFLYFMTRLNT